MDLINKVMVKLGLMEPPAKIELVELPTPRVIAHMTPHQRHIWRVEGDHNKLVLQKLFQSCRHLQQRIWQGFRAQLMLNESLVFLDRESVAVPEVIGTFLSAGKTTDCGEAVMELSLVIQGQFAREVYDAVLEKVRASDNLALAVWERTSEDCTLRLR